MEILRKRILSGLGWSGASQFFTQGLSLVITAILARLLSPHEFGLLAMVTVITGFAANFSDLSLGASIIQKQGISSRHLNSVFWLNLMVGGLLTFVFGLASPLVAGFYDEPLLESLTLVVAVSFTLNSLAVVQIALLEKSLNFRAKFWVDVLSISVAGGVALSMAFAGMGVWSLVGQSLVAGLVRIMVVWRLSNWRPQRGFDLAAIKELMQFGKHVMGFGIISYWGINFDKLLIGRLMGGAPLGLYNLSDGWMRLPLANITNIASSVMFPALSSVQGDLEVMKRLYLRSNRMIALLTFPMMMGLCALAEPSILAVYGKQWAPAVFILQILCFAGMSQSVYNTAAWVFLSCGRADILFRLGVYATAVRVTGVLVGIHWGLTGVALAYVIGGAFIWYPTWIAAGGQIRLRFGEMLRNLAGPFYCAAAMGALVWVSDTWVLVGQPAWLRLIVQVPAGIGIYRLLIARFQLAAWHEVRDAISEMGGNRSRLVQWLCGGDIRVNPGQQP